MNRIFTTAALATALSASVAFAEGHAQPGNSGAAKAMNEAKSAAGADIAPSVSGKNATEAGSGWGNNAGVSKSGKGNNKP